MDFLLKPSKTSIVRGSPNLVLIDFFDSCKNAEISIKISQMIMDITKISASLWSTS